MQKLILSCSIAVCSIAIAATTAVTSSEAQSNNLFFDSISPQVIERIGGLQVIDKIPFHMVTFKNVAGESNNYEIPNWVFSKYKLQVGTAANLYNRDTAQVKYADRYIAESTQKFEDISSRTDSRDKCLLSQGYTTQGSSSTKQVLLKAKDCPSTIPVVGMISGSTVTILSIDATQF